MTQKPQCRSSDGKDDSSGEQSHLRLECVSHSMAIFQITPESLTPLSRTTLHQQAFKEREDLQRLLKQSMSLMGEDLFLLAEEFSQWTDSKRRIDLLALDRDGALVVIELKRTEDGGHMELQAIRYASMISTLTFQQAVLAHAEFIEAEPAQAQSAILDFLATSEPPDDFGATVRIILIAPDFSKEITTAVLWLNSNGLDIRCIRLRPYTLEGRTLLEVEQIIPLREAQDYTVRLKEKKEEARQSSESNIDFTRYDLTADGQVYRNLWKRNLIWQAVKSAAAAGLTIEALTSIIPAKKMVIVEGHLRGEEFLTAAVAARAKSGYVFRPARLFIDDAHLIDVGDHTVALSNQWGLPSLPRVDQIIAAVPSAKMSYKPTDDSQ